MAKIRGAPRYTSGFCHALPKKYPAFMYQLFIIRCTSGDSYEAARSLNQKLLFHYAEDFFDKRNVDFGMSQMRTLHLIGEDGTYTNLAFLLSDQCTHAVKLAVFEGSRKSVFRDRRELYGSVLEQLEEAYDYIDKYNRTRAEFFGLDRIDLRDYPVEAVREALLNAIVHRDYLFRSPILISIFEDRMEFVSIGGLVKGICLDDVMLGVSALRNQNLANIFYRLRLIEAYGTGILKINESYSDYSVKPVIEVSDHAFKITLPNTNFNIEKGVSQRDAAKITTSYEKKEERIHSIIEMCRKKGFVVRKDLESDLKISQATAILLLRELNEEGLLIKKGAAKNVKYYLADD